MMEKVKDLKSLLVEQLKKLYNGEKQQQTAFPGFVQHLSDQELKNLINEEVEGIQQQLIRLETAFKKLGVSSITGSSNIMGHLLKEATELLNKSAQKEISDAAQIMALQQIKHYEIAVYGSLCSYARTLGEEDVAGLLHENLEDEKTIDQRLTELAEQRVNEKAKEAVGA